MKMCDLFEAPLPPDWDVDVFSPSVPFKHRVAYAKERAKQVGRGSARVVFETPYKGRKTALKIATNRKGMVQNQEEIKYLDDWYLQGTGIVIPLIDYDERSPTPTWIHTEFADKITNSQLTKFFGASMQSIVMYLGYAAGRNRHGNTLPQQVHDNEYFQQLQDAVLSGGVDPRDLTQKANWGIYKGNPVIIDLGFNDVTAKLYR